MGQILAVNTTHYLALLAAAFLQEFVDAIVTVEAAAILQVEVAGFITLNASC